MGWGYCDCTASPTTSPTASPTVAPSTHGENSAVFTDEIVLGLGGGGGALVIIVLVLCCRRKRGGKIEYIRMGEMMPADDELMSDEFGDDAIRTGDNIFTDGPDEPSV